MMKVVLNLIQIMIERILLQDLRQLKNGILENKVKLGKKYINKKNLDIKMTDILEDDFLNK
jgi:hypothetical protein